MSTKETIKKKLDVTGRKTEMIKTSNGKYNMELILVTGLKFLKMFMAKELDD